MPIVSLASVIPRFSIEIEDIDLVNRTKYLGLMIDGNLRWDIQIKSSWPFLHSYKIVQQTKQILQDDAVGSMDIHSNPATIKSNIDI